MTPDPQRIAEIKTRVQEATPEPWVVYPSGDEDGLLGFNVDGMPWGIRGMFELRADADFIAHARRDVPYLLECVQALEAKVNDLLQKNDKLSMECEHLSCCECNAEVKDRWRKI